MKKQRQAEIPSEPFDVSHLLVGQSPRFLDVLRLLTRLAEHANKVLILGETGTGKELVAQAIHRLGPRSTNPFVAVNCAALPGSLVESELFGHATGAFTDAKEFSGRVGEAEGGTLLLDEINSFPLVAQAKLLRFLENDEVYPVGSARARRVNVRVLAATNADLEQAVRQGHFRADLFHRLSGFVLKLPPLRERLEDIPILARHFLEQYAQQSNQPTLSLTQEAIGKLLAYSWPGNVRELKHAIQTAALFSTEPALSAEAFTIRAERSENLSRRAVRRADALTYFSNLMHLHDWNHSAAAQTAQLSTRALYNNLQRLGIRRQKPRAANG